MISSPAPIKVKFLSKNDAEDNRAIWSPMVPKDGFRNVEFTFDAADMSYDFLAVYEGLPKWSDRKTTERFEPLSCARRNTILITTEPPSIRLDGPNFMKQFGQVLTNKAPELVNHPSQIRQTPPLRWFYGRPMDGVGDWVTVDHLSQSNPNKTLNLSTVCSNKQMSHTVHAARLGFVMALRERLPELDVFGRGIRPIADKSEAMRDYRYHIAIENHIEAGHWTEKLADCFLAECLPFYFGDPAYAKAFPKDAVIPIDIFNLDSAVFVIRQAIENNEYENRKSAILEAKRRVLENHNTLGWIAEFVRDQNLPQSSEAQERIYSRHAFRRKHPQKALSDLIFCSLAKRKPSAQPLQLPQPSLD